MITAQLDDRGLMRAIDEVARRADQDFFRELAPEARADQRDHAKNQEGPESHWAPRKEVPGRRKRKTRRILGRLPGAIQVRTHPDAVEIQSRVRWSGIHQDGGTANNGAQIPARPFLWWSEEFLDVAGESALIFITRNWGR